MAAITIPVSAYMLTLVPQTNASPRPGDKMPGFADGKTMDSGWTEAQIKTAFKEANAVWLRLAGISFAPVTIKPRTETVPFDESNIWAWMLNNLNPSNIHGVSVYFVGELIRKEGGWSHGRMSVVSGAIALKKTPEFAGRILAHELGHLLVGDPDHLGDGGDETNLMFENVSGTRSFKGGKETFKMAPPIISADQKKDAIKQAGNFATPPGSPAKKP